MGLEPMVSFNNYVKF